MSRSGYSDDLDSWSLICWRGAVKSAIRGQRGQAVLRELLAALDAMPVKRLIAHDLQLDGQFCTLGVLGAKRGIAMQGIDPYDRESIAERFDIAGALAAEIVFENDDNGPWSGNETPEERWIRMRSWIDGHILQEEA